MQAAFLAVSAIRLLSIITHPYVGNHLNLNLHLFAGLLKENEHFIVWMRNAVLPKFRKLWGRIESDIPAGTILRVNIQNQYNTYRFGGTKRVVLSTTSWMGGRNDFLGLAYIIVGIASIMFGFVIAAIGWRWPRKLGDVSLLSWKALTKNEPIHEPASH